MLIPDFKEQLEKQIADHRAEAARLQEWVDGLTADGFDWSSVTDDQAWVVNHYKFAGGGTY